MEGTVPIGYRTGGSETGSFSSCKEEAEKRAARAMELVFCVIYRGEEKCWQTGSGRSVMYYYFLFIFSR